MTLTREQVVWAYNVLLNRDPESEQVISSSIGTPNFETLCERMILSAEFQKRVSKFPQFRQPPKKWVCANVFDDREMWLDLGDKFVSHGCLSGVYEPLVTEFIQSNVHKGQVCLDIGANIGWHTLHMADAVGATGKVHAYEAHPTTASYLEKTITANNLTEVIDVRAYGLWDVDATLEMIAPEHPVNRGGSYILGETAISQNTVPVALKRLDDMQIGHVDFVKIDVEGAEPRVWRGGRELAMRSKPLIVSELHPAQLKKVSGCSVVDYLDFFSALGYKCLDLENPGAGEIADFPENHHKGIMDVVFVPDHRHGTITFSESVS